jgi:hypothetical protein
MIEYFSIEKLNRQRDVHLCTVPLHSSHIPPDRMNVTAPDTLYSEERLNQPSSTPTIEPGDFSFVREPLYRMFLHDAYQAVELADAWSALRYESPPADKGYMFSTSSVTDTIQNYMRYLNDHSGASYALTMRCMERIAKKGWATFVKETMASQNH